MVDYNEAKSCRNLRTDINDHAPSAIVRVATAEEVQAVVLCASAVGVQVSARSGAHGFDNFACAGQIIIDVTEMVDLEVDEATKVVEFGPGHTHGQLYEKLSGFSLVVYGGTEASSGMGLWLGCGRGMMTNYLGLACDVMRGIEFIDAHGQLRKASSEENPDMFWASRGGGGEVRQKKKSSFDTVPFQPFFELS